MAPMAKQQDEDSTQVSEDIRPLFTTFIKTSKAIINNDKSGKA